MEALSLVRARRSLGAAANPQRQGHAIPDEAAGSAVLIGTRLTADRVESHIARLEPARLPYRETHPAGWLALMRAMIGVTGR